MCAQVIVETFSCFKDEKRSFKLWCLGDDCKGILALSEAAYLLVEGESNIFLDAINSTTTYLKEYVVKHNNNENNDGYLCTLVTCPGTSTTLKDAQIGDKVVHWCMQEQTKHDIFLARAC